MELVLFGTYITLLACKLAGLIETSWVWLLTPIWLLGMIVGAMTVIIGIISIFVKPYKDYPNKDND
jgi:hypothetical protein